MATLLAAIVQQYDRLWQLRDQRLDHWPLMNSPWPTAFVCLMYVAIVKKLGPHYMRHRAAFQLRPLIIAYNAAQVAFSLWMFYEFGEAGWFHGHRFQCQPVDRSSDPITMRMIRVSWWFFISKFTELLDTIFFVLRKKDNQISVLHVLHHGLMPFSMWIMVRFVPTGHETFAGMLNSFVHIIMYFYYLLAAVSGPQYQRFLWWKKYVTSLQLVQFVVGAYHSLLLLFVECDYPRPFVLWIVCHQILFLLMFSNFYKASYRSAKAEKIQ